jgi:hypothetical protein
MIKRDTVKILLNTTIDNISTSWDIKPKERFAQYSGKLKNYQGFCTIIN